MRGLWGPSKCIFPPLRLMVWSTLVRRRYGVCVRRGELNSQMSNSKAREPEEREEDLPGGGGADSPSALFMCG